MKICLFYVKIAGLYKWNVKTYLAFTLFSGQFGLRPLAPLKYIPHRQRNGIVKWNLPLVSEFLIKCHLSWGSGGGANNLSHVLNIGISYSQYHADRTVSSTQSINSFPYSPLDAYWLWGHDLDFQDHKGEIPFLHNISKYFTANFLRGLWLNQSTYWISDCDLGKDTYIKSSKMNLQRESENSYIVFALFHWGDGHLVPQHAMILVQTWFGETCLLRS